MWVAYYFYGSLFTWFTNFYMHINIAIIVLSGEQVFDGKNKREKRYLSPSIYHSICKVSPILLIWLMYLTDLSLRFLFIRNIWFSSWGLWFCGWGWFLWLWFSWLNWVIWEMCWLCCSCFGCLWLAVGFTHWEWQGRREENHKLKTINK